MFESLVEIDGRYTAVARTRPHSSRAHSAAHQSHPLRRAPGVPSRHGRPHDDVEARILGSDRRARPGHLIAEPGILKQDGVTE